MITQKKLTGINFSTLAKACLTAASEATLKHDKHDIRVVKYSTAHACSFEEAEAVISTIEAEELAQARIQAKIDVCTEFANYYKLKGTASWLPSQLIHYFSTWTPQRNEEGKYCGKATVRFNLANADDHSRGMYMFAMYANRSSFLPTQSLPAAAPYSSLVPYILSAFKKYHNISYNSWAVEGLDYVLEPALYDAIITARKCAEDPEWLAEMTPDALVRERVAGLEYKTGAKQGDSRSPETSHMLYGLSPDSPLYNLSRLARVMYTQIWCAHPTNRTQYMILDPIDLDKVPDPIVSQPIFFKPKNTFAQDLGADEGRPPWE